MSLTTNNFIGIPVWTLENNPKRKDISNKTSSSQKTASWAYPIKIRGDLLEIIIKINEKTQIVNLGTSNRVIDLACVYCNELNKDRLATKRITLTDVTILSGNWGLNYSQFVLPLSQGGDFVVQLSPENVLSSIEENAKRAIPIPLCPPLGECVKRGEELLDQVMRLNEDITSFDLTEFYYLARYCGHYVSNFSDPQNIHIEIKLLCISQALSEVYQAHYYSKEHAERGVSLVRSLNQIIAPTSKLTVIFLRIVGYLSYRESRIRKLLSLSTSEADSINP